MECNYSLKSFGLPLDEVPITNSGHVKNKNAIKFIAARTSIESVQLQRYQQQEQQKKQEGGDGNEAIPVPPIRSGIECPEVNCVILGNRAQSNTANLEFRNILKVMERHREEKISRGEFVDSMKDFINSIIRTAKSPEHNLRFFFINKKTWLFIELTDSKELYNKVSQALRDQRKRSRIENKLLEETIRNSYQRQHKRQQHNHHHYHHQERGTFLFQADDSSSGSSIIGFDAANRLKGSSTSFCAL